MVLVNGGIRTKATISLSIGGIILVIELKLRVFQTKIWVSSLFPTMKLESLLEALKFRIADEILGLNQLDWNDR